MDILCNCKFHKFFSSTTEISIYKTMLILSRKIIATALLQSHSDITQISNAFRNYWEGRFFELLKAVTPGLYSSTFSTWVLELVCFDHTYLFFVGWFSIFRSQYLPRRIILGMPLLSLAVMSEVCLDNCGCVTTSFKLFMFLVSTIAVLD